MSGMEIFGLGASLVGSGISAYGSYQQGKAQKRAAEAEAAQAEINAQNAKIAGIQDETKRREALVSNIEQVEAIQAGRGAGGPSPRAIVRNQIDLGERDISTAQLTAAQKVDTLKRQATIARERGETSMMAGELGAVTGVLGTATNLYNLKTYGKK